MTPNRDQFRNDAIELFSDEITETTEEFVEGMRTVYDRESGAIRSERFVGVCSLCGDSLAVENSARCMFGCQICKSKGCSRIFNGRRICLKEIEVYFGTRDEAIVLLGRKARLGIDQIRKFAGFTEAQTRDIAKSLIRRGYLKMPFCDPLNTPRFTPAANNVLPLLIETYAGDPTFVSFLVSVGGGNVQTA